MPAHRSLAICRDAARQCLVCGVLAAAGAGCASSAPPPAATVAAAMEAGSGCRLTREERVALGGFKLALARTLVRWAGQDDDLREAQEILSHLDRVEVTSYRVHGGAGCAAEMGAEGLERELRARGWRPMVQERRDGGASRVFTREGPGGAMDGLYVVEVDGGELEIVLLRGDIEQLLATAMASDAAAAARAVAGGS